MASAIKYEFQLKHFGFVDCDPVRFYKSQWSNNIWIFWGIKLLLLAYWMAWFIANFVVRSQSDSLPINNWWIFLTNWGVTLLLIYFLSSFGLVTYGLSTGNGHSKIRPSVAKLNEASFGTTIVMDNRNISVQPKIELRWFHIFVWIFHEVAFAMALFVTILFWSLLAPADLNASVELFSINAHLINLIIMLIDLFLCDIPFRLLHFYHVSISGAVYGLFSLILHWTGYNSAIYGVLDWASGTGLAIGLVLGSIFVAVPITHCIGFGLYHLRRFIAQKCLGNSNTSSSPNPTLNESRMAGNSNIAFIVDSV